MWTRTPDGGMRLGRRFAHVVEMKLMAASWRSCNATCSLSIRLYIMLEFIIIFIFT